MLLLLFLAALQHVTVGRERRPAARTDTSMVYLVGPLPSAPLRRTGSREPQAPAPAGPLAPAVDTSAAADPGPVISAPTSPGPSLGDGSLWVAPRPALPAAVADQLYGPPPERRDEVAMARLRAMVDSLNDFLDEEQRAQRLPDWTVGGNDGPKWGIDPQWVHLGDIKIPTAALALLGGLLPQGTSYDESLRQRQLADMRRDLLYSAWRAQTFQEFQRYVRETRERRRQERDAERARRDTTQVIP